jgi:DNA-binding transcriptional ArsR family regulator
MPPAKPPTGQELEPSVCHALKHPLRARILEVVNECEMSPSQFVRLGLLPDELYENYQQALSLTSYHFRELAKEGVLEVVRLIPRRGASERIYRGVSRVFFSDKEFENLPYETRKDLSKASFQGVVARTDGAIRSGTFDKRADRHLTWRAVRLDEEGWTDLKGILADAFHRAEEARVQAEERLSQGDNDGFPATFAMLGFESPAMKLRF